MLFLLVVRSIAFFEMKSTGKKGEIDESALSLACLELSTASSVLIVPGSTEVPSEGDSVGERLHAISTAISHTFTESKH